MLDSKLLRNDLEEVAKKLKIRRFDLDIDLFKSLDNKRKTLQIKVEHLRNQRNQISKSIGIAKAKGEDIYILKNNVSELGESLSTSQQELNEVSDQLNDFLLTIPNIPDASVPAGNSEDANELVKTWGEIPEFNFTAKDHVELGENLSGIDFNAAAKLSGSRFVVMKNKIARLHRALAQFMLDTHTTEHGYEEVSVPVLVNIDCLYGTGQMPKFADDQFMVKGEHEMALIPTAEVPVTNLARDSILSAEELPKKYVCHSLCFRSEAGSYGKDTRGMIRNHQFEKVELVQFVKRHESAEKLEELTGHAEIILQKLNLPYRVVTLCGGDLGFSAVKTYDLEVWLPAQQSYREISSCSSFEAFQARRMQARYRDPETKKPELLHTINGSGLAVGRTLIAVMENYQQEDGSIAVPEVLQSYMGGIEVIN